jgi:hypothetical protein
MLPISPCVTSAADLEGDLPPWAGRKQLKKTLKLVRDYHNLFAGWWKKHGEIITLLA